MPTRNAIVLIATVCVLEALSMAAFATFPTLIPVFQHEWSMNNTQAGWISGIFFGGYVIAVAVLTALTDRVDAKRIYLVSMALSSIAALGFALFAEGLWSASAWSLLQGVGLAGTYMPGLRILVDLLPARYQSRATAFYTSSFGIGASFSYLISGGVAAELGWQWAFGICALGPGIAFVLGMLVLPSRPPVDHRSDTHLLDFRPAIANRRALGFTLAYTVHNSELFAFRAWLVTFLLFAQAQQPAGALGLNWAAANIAALANLIAVPASILGNELSQRIGRQRTATIVMTLSAVVGVLFGFSATLPFVLVVLLALCYSATIAGESSTVTAGMLKVADPRHKGTTIAMHSTVGFVGAVVGPLLFGMVLDAAGGQASPVAWGLAFCVMGCLILLGPVAITRLVGREEPLY